MKRDIWTISGAVCASGNRTIVHHFFLLIFARPLSLVFIKSCLGPVNFGRHIEKGLLVPVRALDQWRWPRGSQFWVRECMQRHAIDLFSLYVLFSHFRPRDATQGNSFFQMSSYARGNVRITNDKTKENSHEGTRSLKWENKMYKLKRSIDCFVRRHGYVSNASGQLFPLPVILSCWRWGRVRCFCLGIYERSRINPIWEVGEPQRFCPNIYRVSRPTPPPQLKAYLPFRTWEKSFSSISGSPAKVISSILRINGLSKMISTFKLTQQQQQQPLCDYKTVIVKRSTGISK